MSSVEALAKVKYRRALVETVVERLGEPRRFMQVLTGPRQTGKTTAALQALETQKNPSHFASADAVFSLAGEWLEVQWEAARRLTDEGRRAAVLVIDEIQNIPQWSSYAKKLWDEDAQSGIDLRVLISGSSSLLLQKGLSESLMGRYELLRFSHWGCAEMHAAFGYTLDEYLRYGGYPGAASLRDDFFRWSLYMREAVIEATLSKDVLQMQDIRKPAVLRRLFLLGAGSSSRELSFRKMLGQLDDKGNTDTIANYLELLTKAGMLAGLQKYDGEKLIGLRRSSPRLMVFDTALMTASLAGSQADLQALLETPDLRGAVVESAVGAYLLARSQKEGFELFWWRQGDDEVDFVLRRGAQLVALEVKSGRNKRARGLYRFCKLYPAARPMIVGDRNCSLSDFLSGKVELFAQ
jgi:predicted AAA+ superfamily ATPase